RAHAWNESEPVCRDDENEDRGEEPERAPHQMRTDDALEKAVEAFDQPFQEVLASFGYLLHVARGELRKDNEADGNDPGDDHRIGDGEPEWARDLYRALR